MVRITKGQRKVTEKTPTQVQEASFQRKFLLINVSLGETFTYFIYFIREKMQWQHLLP